jgi:hypothetical protein
MRLIKNDSDLCFGLPAVDRPSMLQQRDRRLRDYVAAAVTRAEQVLGPEAQKQLMAALGKQVDG